MDMKREDVPSLGTTTTRILAVSGHGENHLQKMSSAIASRPSSSPYLRFNPQLCAQELFPLERAIAVEDKAQSTILGKPNV